MLSTRGKNVLNFIVSDYINESNPVASSSIVSRHKLGVSSATIRNEVADLENYGYITRPYSSAGSIPLQKGYREYVETIKKSRLPVKLRTNVHRQLLRAERYVEDWTEVAATLLAGLVGNMAIVSFPKSREARVKHLELVPVQKLSALLIIVFDQYKLKRRIIRFKQPVTQRTLDLSVNRLRHLVVGLSGKEVESKIVGLPRFERELAFVTSEILKEEDRAKDREHYLDGLRNLLAQPEFATSEKMSAVVGGVEDGSLAKAILDETPESGGVKVIIGRENRSDALWPFGLVLAHYGTPSGVTGTVGTIGPMRMKYDVTIAGVELMVGVMSGLVDDNHRT